MDQEDEDSRDQTNDAIILQSGVHCVSQFLGQGVGGGGRLLLSTAEE